LPLPRFLPATPVRARDPFDHPDFLFELKHDGWRALAYLYGDRCELVSRRGNAFKSFAPLRALLATIGREVILSERTPSKVNAVCDLPNDLDFSETDAHESRSAKVFRIVSERARLGCAG
jgi:hypothetical protein